MINEPLKLAVTGATGQVGYAWLFLMLRELEREGRRASIALYDLPEARTGLEAVREELEDCASPALGEVTLHQELESAFSGATSIVLLGAKARLSGMSRGDLLLENAKIMAEQGRAIGRVAAPSCDVLVVANPCNTNALIAWSHSGCSPSSFRAMTRLDHNRATALLAQRAGASASEVTRAVVWGNHSETCLPDRWHARIGTALATERLPAAWLAETWAEQVRGRGGEILRRRGHTSAGSAAWAATMAWWDPLRLKSGEWTSAGLWTQEGSAFPAGLYCGVACTSVEGRLVLVEEAIEPDLLAALQPSLQELLDERDAVRHLLGGGGA